MLEFIRFPLYGLLLLHSSLVFIIYAQNVQTNLHNNGTNAKEDKLPQDLHHSGALQNGNDPKDRKGNGQLKLVAMPLLANDNDAVITNLKTRIMKNPTQNAKANDSLAKKGILLNLSEKEETTPSPLAFDSSNSPSPLLNRTGRQLFYNPNFFYIQNIGAEGSQCITSRGLLGICLDFNRCNQHHQQRQQREKRQLAFVSLVQLPYMAHYVQQPEQFCSFFDQYSRTQAGVCCTGINTVTPFPAPQEPEHLQPPMSIDEQHNEIPWKDMETTAEDSDVLEPPSDFLNIQPEPPIYDNIELQDGNNVIYDPVDENLKQSQVFNSNFNGYPWTAPFSGFSGVAQWPPPLPTHPPLSDSWPPPIPTHPPNHHYPTHPPGSQGPLMPVTPATTTTTTTRRPATLATTKRPPMYPSYPSYPSYPTYRPVTTTSTTTTRRPVVGGDSGPTPAGLPLQCGTKNTGSPDQERIVGGTNASPHEFPWIAVIFRSGKQFCGGSLITNSHILTAAHCVARMTSWDVAALTVHLGDYNIRTDYEVQHVSRRIKRLVRHKGFDFSILHNDVAVLTLSEPVKYTQEIQPICLPTSAMQQTRSYSGHVATVAGWGSLRENGPQPSVLQKVQIPIWTNSDCAQKYGRAAPGGIIESMICAGQASKDSCSGDSGGPMIVSEGGRYVQVGIVSWGIGCGKGQYPGVYTRVTSLLPWIYKNLK